MVGGGGGGGCTGQTPRLALVQMLQSLQELVNCLYFLSVHFNFTFYCFDREESRELALITGMV